MTTATDVYSLGVVLYEVLTGVSPYGVANPSLPEFAQLVCEREPQKPSLSIHRSPAEREKAPVIQPAAFGDISPEKHRKQLSGDLDNIVLMALRKEPSRRYTSVNDLQEDIRRHLENIPVIARNDTAWYRASKFVARHKARRLCRSDGRSHPGRWNHYYVRAERVAKRRFDDVRALANSLIFDVHDSVKDLPGSTPARKIIVDRALQYLNVLAMNQPAMSDCSANWPPHTRGSDRCKATILRITWAILREHSPATRRRLNFASRLTPPRRIGTIASHWRKAIAS